jgi:acetyltransferase
VQLSRFTQFDYDLEMCFIAQKAGKTLGNVRLVMEPQWDAGAPKTAEFGLLVAHDAQHHGLARLLLDKGIKYARSRDVAIIRGSVLKENMTMRKFCAAAGFTEQPPIDKDDDSVHVELRL